MAETKYTSHNKNSPNYYQNDPNWKPGHEKTRLRAGAAEPGDGLGLSKEALKSRRKRAKKHMTDLLQAPVYFCDFETTVPPEVYEYSELARQCAAAKPAKKGEQKRLDRDTARRARELSEKIRDVKADISTRVWLAGAVHASRDPAFDFVSNNIEAFVEWMNSFDEGLFLFHNLKFDGTFLVDYWLRHGWEAITADDEGHLTPEDGKDQFAPTIDNMGAWYRITVFKWDPKTGKHRKNVIRDSLKVILAKVESIARDWTEQQVKGECDYDKLRPVGYEPTPEEIDYCLTDCRIVAEAFEVIAACGIEGETAASCALKRFKATVGDFNDLFPKLDLGVDEFIRKAYKGGFTWCNPRFQNRIIEKKGIVLDINSMYPYVMESKPLPLGEPEYFTGNPKNRPNKNRRPLFVAHCIVTASCKEDGVPVIQHGKTHKGPLDLEEGGYVEPRGLFFNMHASRSPYARDVDGEEMWLSNIDLHLLEENYEVYSIEYLDGFQFKAKIGIATDYLETFAEMKRTSKGGRRSLAKLMLNSLYGKFGSNPERGNKLPVLGEDGLVHYINLPKVKDERNEVYVPYAVFVTAWARQILVKCIRAFGLDRFCYCDTDSVHVIGTAVPECVEIHDSRFGAWKVESTFDRAKYIHTKCYCEETLGEDGKPSLDIKIAGCPANVRDEQLTSLEAFVPGAKFFGKLSPMKCKGGTVLYPSEFQIDTDFSVV